MATIREEVEKKWPSKGPHAVGCLLFLRLVCPVIIAPEQFGLAPASKITAAARRALVLVSKVGEGALYQFFFSSIEVLFLVLRGLRMCCLRNGRSFKRC